MRTLITRIGPGGAAVLAALLCSSATWADQPKRDAAEAPEETGDVVILRDGGRVHGKISKIVGDEYLDIVTDTGKERRILMRDVEYAGAASAAPPAAEAEEGDAAAPEPPAAEAEEPEAPEAEEAEAEVEAEPVYQEKPDESGRAKVEFRSSTKKLLFHAKRTAGLPTGTAGEATAASPSWFGSYGYWMVKGVLVVTPSQW